MNKASLFSVKNYMLLLLALVSYSNIAKAQTPTNCLEIGSILVDACGSPEGENEMVRFQVGPTAIATSNLTVTWPNNSFLGISPVNTTTNNIVSALNATIVSCGYLVQPVGGLLPAGKTVLLITSTNVSLSANSFANLSDTLYVIFQNAGNTAGHFANYSTPSGIRTLTMGTITPACSDAVSYDKVLLINQSGGHGGSSALNDGATVEYTWAGTATYVNNGCQAPFVTNTSNAGTNTSMCSSGTLALNGTATGNYTGVIWQGPGMFSNPTALSTNYTPAAGASGTITLSLGVIGHCHDTIFSTVNVAITPAPTPVIAASGSTTFCQGNSITLTASGGSTYSWSTGATTAAISVNTGGTYTVTATGTCGSQTATQAVTVNPLPTATITPAGSTTFCSGGSVTLNASGIGAYSWSTGSTASAISVSATGTYTLTSTNGCGTQTATQAVTVNPLPTATITPAGPATFCSGGSVTLNASGIGSYSWSTGSTAASITVSTAGTYTLTSTNGCGTQTATQAVTVNPLPTASITPTGPTTFCSGGSVTLNASGVGAYSWSTGSTASTISVSTTGTYTLTSTNSCGTQTATQSVTVNPLPNAAITPSGSTTFCTGGSVTLTASGGTSYVWSTGSTASTITVSTAGTYTVTATNSCGSQTATQVITTTATPVATINSAASSFCTGGNVVLHATGTGSYTWTGGSTNDSLVVTGGGTYIVTSNTSCGTASDTIMITQNPLPNAVITPGGSTTFCTGDSVTLTASGTGSYVWSTGSTASAITVFTAGTYTLTATNVCGSAQATQTVNTTLSPAASINSAATSFCAGSNLVLHATGSGSYTWTGGSTNDSLVITAGGTYVVTSSTTCGTASDTVTITQNPLPNPAISASGSTTFCTGDSVTLNASGGTSYAWSTGSTASTITVSTAGTYTVTATNSCGSQTATQVITTTATPVATINSAASSFCTGGNVVLHATGTGSYTWTGGSTNDSLVVTTGGTYIVTSSTTCGTASDTISITQNPLPVALITPAGSTTICAGNSVVLNGSGGTSYVWLPTGAATNSISVTTAGTYTLSAINGCGVDTATSTVTIINAPVANITPASTTTICAGTTVTLNASGGGTYTWSNGQTGNSITTGQGGTYILTATNTCGSSNASITVTVDSVTALFSATPTSGVYPLPVTFSNNSSASAIAYSWDFGDNANSTATAPGHTYQAPGVYNVVLTAVNAAGCTDTYMLTITVLENPSILQIPNVFTPNNDGDNDLFKVTSEGIVEFSCAVFDRWGIKMADLNTTNEGWDGRTSAGEPASDGTYYYIIKAKGAEGKEYNEKGFIQLIRK